MSENETEKSEAKPRYEKGDKVAIVTGRKNLGVRGEIFWIGENKYGPGVRYGMKDADGETYWVDEGKLGSPEEAPPEPDKPPREDKPALAKGTLVEITGGREGLGEQGEIFWVGDSKFGQGKRYGIRGRDEETYWVDDQFVEALETPAAEITAASPDGASAPTAAASGAPPVDAPMPDPDEFADFQDDGPRIDDAPFPEAGPPPDDAPFPDDDVPF